MEIPDFLINAIATISNSPGVWGFIGVLTGGLITHKLEQTRDRDTQIRVAFAGLHGIRKSLKQLYVSRFEAFIYSDYHEARWRLSGQTSAIDFNEALRWMNRSEELVFEIAKTEERLAQTCGTILVNFKKNSELVGQVESLLSHAVPKLRTRPESNWSVQQVHNWRMRAVPEVQASVDQIFDPLFTQILNNPSFGI